MDYLVEHINIENCFKAHVFTNEEKEYINKNKNRWVDKEFVKKSVKKHYYYFQCCDKNLAQDEDFVVELIRIKPIIIQLVENPLRSNATFIKKCFIQNYNCIEHLSKKTYRVATPEEKEFCFNDAYSNAYQMHIQRGFRFNFGRMLPHNVVFYSRTELEEYKGKTSFFVYDEKKYHNGWTKDKNLALFIVSKKPTHLQFFDEIIRRDVEVLQATLSTIDMIHRDKHNTRGNWFHFGKGDYSYFEKIKKYRDLFYNTEHSYFWYKEYYN